jgi:hypothetical protein
MRRAVLAFALVLAGCSSPSSKPAEVEKVLPPPSPELLQGCFKHLELLHKVRLSRELARDGMEKLMGPAPSPAELGESRKKLVAMGLEGDEDTYSSASLFAKLAQPTVQRGGYTFLGWTPDLDDVGLAKIRARQPGQWKQLWAKAVSYEVLLLDGFVVLDYPRLREQVLDHRASARDVPRRRGSLLVIDAAGLVADQKKAVEEKKSGADAVARLGVDELLKEIELREAGYLRFQDEVGAPSTLDQLVTWLEVLEGSPEVAFAGGVVSAGDAPDELRRAGAVQAIVLKLAASDTKEERAEVLTLPPDERRKKLKELAPHFIRSELGH